MGYRGHAGCDLEIQFNAFCSTPLSFVPIETFMDADTTAMYLSQTMMPHALLEVMHANTFNTLGLHQGGPVSRSTQLGTGALPERVRKRRTKRVREQTKGKTVFIHSYHPPPRNPSKDPAMTPPQAAQRSSFKFATVGIGVQMAFIPISFSKVATTPRTGGRQGKKGEGWDRSP